MIKQWVISFAGKREKLTTLDLNHISSVLIKPIGDAIGDAVAHTAHLNQLRAFNPNLKLGVIVTERNRAIFENSGLANELIDDIAISYFKQRHKWDLYLDFQPTFTTRTLLLEKILSPKYLVVLNKKDKKSYNVNNTHNFNIHFPMDNNTHIADYLSKSRLGEYLNSQDAIYHLQQNNIPTAFTQQHWKNYSHRILIAPQGSGREIPVEELSELFNQLDQQFLSNSTFLLSVLKNGDEYFKNLTHQLKHKLNIEKLSNLTICEYLDIVRTADLIICVDSGTVHIACALKKPMLAFYANNQSNLNRWYPKISKDIECKIAISQKESHSDHTSNFNIIDAAQWLNNYLMSNRK